MRKNHNGYKDYALWNFKQSIGNTNVNLPLQAAKHRFATRVPPLARLQACFVLISITSVGEKAVVFCFLAPMRVYPSKYGHKPNPRFQ